MNASTTDRFEKEILLKAPRPQVWQAISQAEAFGKWFGVNLKGQVFAAGASVQGPITIPDYEHVIFDALIVTLEPERYLAFRWHPYAVEPGVDYSSEPTTLVEFTLEEVPGGTLLKVAESGFDQLPPPRCTDAFRMNSQGWSAQLINIHEYVQALQ